MGQRKLVEICHSLQLFDFSGPSGSIFLVRGGRLDPMETMRKG